MKAVVACQVKCDICRKDDDGAAIAATGAKNSRSFLLEICQSCIKELEKCRADEYDFVPTEPTQDINVPVNYYGPDWTEIRERILARDGRTCADEEHRAAGGSNVTDKLVVHHIKPLREFGGDYRSANVETNLITLCTLCHGRYHAALNREAREARQ